MKKIFVAGHNGMVGSSIVRQLKSDKKNKVITVSRSQVDLINQNQVESFFKREKFDEVYIAAAKVGGIHANNVFPAEFIFQNLSIQTNIIHASYISGVSKLLFLGSSCIYPKYSEQPIKETELLNGYLESTNEPYAIAKIAGIKMCESYNRQYGVDYRSVMPTNLYGPGDNYHKENSHVIPALIRRFDEAKNLNLQSVTAWGTGKALREFLYVDDMADASIFVMNLCSKIYNKNTDPMLSHINVGSGIDCSIKDLTINIAKVIGYKGEIKWDKLKPDGSPRKLMDSSKLYNLGWSANTKLEDGLKKAYAAYLELRCSG